MDMAQVGKVLVLFAVLLGVVGLLLMVGPRVPLLGQLGRLPGDLSFGNDHVRIFIPLGTSILLSIVLTLVLTLAGRFFR